MAHLIDKDRIVAEIERKKKYAQTLGDTAINSRNLHGLSVNVKLPHSVEEGDKVKIIIVKSE